MTENTELNEEKTETADKEDENRLIIANLRGIRILNIWYVRVFLLLLFAFFILFPTLLFIRFKYTIRGGRFQ